MDKLEGGRVVDPSGGANQARVRAYNERLVLSLVRRHGALSRAEIARRSGLTAQAVTVIIRQLEEEGLLLRGAPVRGRVGQPSTPMRLNPEGAFGLGLEIGRRGAVLMLMDFAGAVRAKRQVSYSYPQPEAILGFAEREVAALVADLPPVTRARIAGLGLAIPFELWNWEDRIGAPSGAMDAWRHVDMERELARRTGFVVSVQNDATAACAAELFFGRGREFASYAYLSIGFFVGGGVVLDHALYPGRTGNAGAFGTVRVGQAALLDVASLAVLEDAVGNAGADLWSEDAHWDSLGAPLEAWIEAAAGHLAMACLSICSVLDFEAVIIDGAMPEDVRTRLVSATRRAIAALDTSGISPFVVEEGSLGRAAPVLGAAALPLMGRYLIDTNVLFKG